MQTETSTRLNPSSYKRASLGDLNLKIMQACFSHKSQIEKKANTIAFFYKKRKFSNKNYILNSSRHWKSSAIAMQPIISAVKHLMHNILQQQIPLFLVQLLKWHLNVSVTWVIQFIGIKYRVHQSCQTTHVTISWKKNSQETNANDLYWSSMTP